ncbi:hypothetical protein [uncultured Thiodictyon sp.]|jgi:hypothetical protein|uniref:hypothetical protein n=1 Tax=uncultured Thiodictyon sp. TaxID=1846217 RepID=UPI0025D51FBE|nr:hypothetical protein [uncultured Thiodictyon sp.]
MALVLSSSVREKLAGKTPPVSEEEILQCFANRSGRYLLDEREQHRTDPPTRWFLAETDYGRLLKVVFIPKDGDVIIRTAYDPNPVERSIYQRYG